MEEDEYQNIYQIKKFTKNQINAHIVFQNINFLKRTWKTPAKNVIISLSQGICFQNNKKRPLYFSINSTHLLKYAGFINQNHFFKAFFQVFNHKK